jgi:hypothetical protein
LPTDGDEVIAIGGGLFGEGADNNFHSATDHSFIKVGVLKKETTTGKLVVILDPTQKLKFRKAEVFHDTEYGPLAYFKGAIKNDSSRAGYGTVSSTDELSPREKLSAGELKLLKSGFASCADTSIRNKSSPSTR